jgi:hypothetical protein
MSIYQTFFEIGAGLGTGIGIILTMFYFARKVLSKFD